MGRLVDVSLESDANRLFQSINPLLILLLAPFFAMLWTWLAARHTTHYPDQDGPGAPSYHLAFFLMAGAGVREARTTPSRFRAKSSCTYSL